MGVIDDLRRELEKAAQEAKRQTEAATAQQRQNLPTPPQTEDAPGNAISTSALPMPPAKRLAVVTCMDTRVLVEKAFDLRPGDAHILRNAGGLVTDDVLRSLAVSHHLLGIEQVIVVGHTDCGLMTFRDADLRARIRQKMGPAANLPGTFGAFSNVETNVRAQMRRVRASGLFPPALVVRGFVYELKTGRLNEVAPESAAAPVPAPPALRAVPGSVPTARVGGRLVREGLQKVSLASVAAASSPSADDFRRKVETMERSEAAPLNALPSSSPASSPAFDLGLPDAPDDLLGASARELVRAFVLGGVLNEPRGRRTPRH